MFAMKNVRVKKRRKNASSGKFKFDKDEKFIADALKTHNDFEFLPRSFEKEIAATSKLAKV